jgi:hypothetical protein
LGKIFYDVEQASRKLDLSVRDVEAKIASGELPLILLGNRRVIPARAIETAIKKDSSSSGHSTSSEKEVASTNSQAPLYNEGEEYYTDVEVARRLNKPYTEILRMANWGSLPVKFIEDKRMFPKQAIDHLAAQEASVGPTRIKTSQESVVPAANTRGGIKKKASRPSQEMTIPGGATTSKEYFTPEQIASALGRSREDIDRMIRGGEIKAARIAGRRWVSSEEVNRIISKREPKRQAKIKQRLPQPHKVLERRPVNQEQQTIAANDLVENHESGPLVTPNEAPNRQEAGSISTDRNMLPRQVVDDLPADKDVDRDAGEEAATEWEQTVTEATQKLGNLVGRVKHMMFKDRLVPDQDEASRTPSEPSSVSQILEHTARGEVDRDDRKSEMSERTGQTSRETDSASELREPANIPENATKSYFAETSGAPTGIGVTGERSAEAPRDDRAVIQISEREVMKTAQRLETSITKVRQMIARGELIQDSQTGHLVKPEPGPTIARDSGAIPNSAKKILDGNARVIEAAQRFGVPARKIRQMVTAGKLVPDPNTGRLVLSTPASTETADTNSVETTTPSAPDIARIRELEDWVKDLREEVRAEKEEKERLTEELEQECKEHQKDVRNAQYQIDQLDAELLNIRMSTNKTVLDARLKQERQLREEAERWARELEAQLDKESVLSSERERLFADMEEKLTQSEARNQELEQSLVSEREKVRRIENDARVLAEVRRLLGAENRRPSETVEETLASGSTARSEREAPGELLIETQHGPWVFRPPFDLEEGEVELIRLVAGEEEITAEQIKRKTGRRRAADDLDELLDRLHEAGLEPIKEVNDRYSLDPDFLQD